MASSAGLKKRIAEPEYWPAWQAKGRKECTSEPCEGTFEQSDRIRYGTKNATRDTQMDTNSASSTRKRADFI